MKAKLNTFRKKLRGSANNKFSLKEICKTRKFEVQEEIMSKDIENIWVNLNKNQQCKIMINSNNLQNSVQ